MRIEFATAGKYWVEAALAVWDRSAIVLYQKPGIRRLLGPAVILLRGVWALAAGVVVLSAVYLYWMEDSAWMLSVFVGSMMLFVTISSARRRLLQTVAMSEFSRDLNEHFNCSYELGERELTYEDPRQILEHPWCEIVRIVATPTLIVIVDSSDRVYGITKHAFSSDDERERFKAELLNRVKGASPA